MPLSEHEQRMLEQMERALYEEDPRFAASIRDTAHRATTRRGAGIGILVASMGVATIIAGLISATAWVSVFGFTAVLGGTYYALRGIAAAAPTEQANPSEPKQRSGFLKGAEERFNKRRDGDQPR